MSLDFSKLAQNYVHSVNPYVPGKPVSELKRELGLTRISKLASNENPLGASPKVAAAIQLHLSEVGRYPDGASYDLRNAMAEFCHVSAENVLLGNGSNEVLELVARTFAGAGDEIIFSQYAFAVYAISTQLVGATPVQVPAVNFAHDLDAMAAAVTDKTKIIYIANPNNPTGTVFNQKAWSAFLAKIPSNVIVVVDEAYIEYAQALMGESYPNVLLDLESHPNLMVTRTFSKAYGLAALRVGALVGHKDAVALMNRVREPFNINAFAQVSAVAALSDQAFIQRVVELNHEGMKKITNTLDESNIEYIASAGNFVTAKFGENAEAINQQFLQEGVILRPQTGYGMKEWLRISIGSPAENRHFVEALYKIQNS